MFKNIIEKLKEAGLSEYAIAARIGCSQPTINRILNEKQKPSYEIGDALVRLLAEIRVPEGRRKSDVAAA